VACKVRIFLVHLSCGQDAGFYSALTQTLTLAGIVDQGQKKYETNIIIIRFSDIFID
jgi:hypothetical protein